MTGSAFDERWEKKTLIIVNVVRGAGPGWADINDGAEGWGGGE